MIALSGPRMAVAKALPLSMWRRCAVNAWHTRRARRDWLAAAASRCERLLIPSMGFNINH